MDQALIILAVFLVFAAIFTRIRMGTAVGLLIAGAIVGPYGFKLITDLEAVAALAELGVVFLLFNIGLEIKFDRLRLFGMRTYGLAVSQLVLTSIGIYLAARQLMVGVEGAAVLGVALALSSTAIVLQILADQGRTLTQTGRLAVATLLVQDLAVAPLLIFIDLLEGGNDTAGSLLHVLLGGAAASILIIASARWVLPAVLRWLGQLKAGELFMVATLIFVLGASWATHTVGLSAAIGALIAGLAVADTEYRHQIAADIAPFREILIGLFFMTVGMQTNMDVIAERPGTVLGIAVGLLLTKGVILTLLALSLGYGRRVSVELGILLAEGSEFAFVALGVAVTAGVVAGALANTLIASVTISMLIVTIVAALARKLINRVEGPAVSSLSRLDADTSEFSNHVVVAGFGQVGKATARHLIGLQIPVLVLDYDHERVSDAWGRGLPVFYGNVARAGVLRAAHLDKANLFVVALPDVSVSSRVIELVRRTWPEIHILARAPHMEDCDGLLEAGADAVVPEGLRTAMDLAERTVLLFESSDLPQPPAD